MAVQLGGGGGVKSDINVTPLVDVMLVLLIIMMVVAPLLQQGVPVKLSKAANSAQKPETQDQLKVTVTADKRFFVDAKPVSKDDLTQHVRDVMESTKKKVVLIAADDDADYGSVMDAMDQLRAAGVEDMGLITDPKSARTQGGE
jgi:biopolymer transport protein ExbD